MVFQAFNLFPHLTVLENVAARARRARTACARRGRARARASCSPASASAGREGDYPDRLSGGQQQRVAIVRALATRPRALLLDEITSALDPELVGEVLEVVRELKAEGMTMLIATHEMGFAREVADEVCFLHDGRIVERGAPEQVLSHPQQPETQRFLRRLLFGHASVLGQQRAQALVLLAAGRAAAEVRAHTRDAGVRAGAAQLELDVLVESLEALVAADLRARPARAGVRRRSLGHGSARRQAAPRPARARSLRRASCRVL